MAKMRLTYYIAASVALAGGVVLDAFNRRPNFYSATVYLSQTPLCFMVLANFAFVCYASLIYALQRALFGDLRIIERERLWERGWISVTETLLIMMTFRDDVGAWFLFILANLVVARMWAWLAESRTEMLEQQPPANPRLFHTRQTASLLVCCVANFGFLKYCVDTVLEQARPGMMVMFAFEFAVLTITSFSNLFRYGIALYEIRETQRQTKAKIEARRAELRAERSAAEARASESAEAAAEVSDTVARLTREEANVDENDVDVPGWEDKGRWVFGLDIITDFLRLVVYLAFFSVLMIFHGIPLHIVRDVYITLRSFLQRIYSFWQYRTATKDMNTRFPDATREELERDGTCIVCREDMRPWPADGEPAMEQRLRAKKLPCGHILHFGCLRSWLERQQVCPTCRRPVLETTTPNTNAGAGAVARQGAQQPALPGMLGNQQGQPPAAPPQNGNQQRPANPPPAGQNQRPNPFAPWRPRTLNLGPFRIAYGHMPADTLNALQQGQLQLGGGTTAPTGSTDPSAGVFQSPASLELELLQIERELSRQIMELNLHQQQLGVVRMLHSELARLRAVHAQAQVMYQTPPTAANATTMPEMFGGPSAATASSASATVPQAQLPSGMTLPEGWTLLPLTRTQPGQQPEWPASVAHAGPSTTAPVGATSAMPSQPQILRPTPTVPLADPAEPRTAPPPGVPSSQDQSTGEQINGIAPSSTIVSDVPSGAPPVTAASAPTWSFDSSAADLPAGEEGKDAHLPASDSGQEAEEAAEQRQTDKGKGRAVTMEDEPEVD